MFSSSTIWYHNLLAYLQLLYLLLLLLLLLYRLHAAVHSRHKTLSILRIYFQLILIEIIRKHYSLPTIMDRFVETIYHVLLLLVLLMIDCNKLLFLLITCWHAPPQMTDCQTQQLVHC